MFRILLIGMGSIGKRHWQILKNLNEWDLFEIELYRFDGWKDAEGFKPDIAFICNPTFMHIETAQECARRGWHLFVEKPIDRKTDGLDELIDIVEKNELTTHVAYPLRFHPILKKIKFVGSGVYFVCHSNLDEWRSYRTYSADYKLGGGALLELSHEIDLAEHLMGEVKEIDGTLAWTENKDTNAETDAFLRITHDGGGVSFHSLGIKSNKEQRFIKTDGIQYDTTVNDQMFLDQTIYFLNNIGNPQLMNNLKDASKLFKKIIAFREGEYARYYNNPCPSGV